MDEKMIMENLKKNVVEYYSRKCEIDKMEEMQKSLKEQNLAMMKNLGKKKGDSVIFDDVGLGIQLIEMIKKIRIDEEQLIELVGIEIVNSLKVVPIAAVETGIKTGKLPPEAKDCIIKKAPIEYTKIIPVNKIDIDS